MRHALPAILAALAVSALHATAEPMKPGESRANVVYGMYSGLALLMDVSRPEHPNGFAVINVRGSGFQAPLVWDAPDLKSQGPRPAVEAALLRAGFTVMTPNHRATPRFRYPAPVEDVQRAARFVRRRAAEFGVRPDRLAAFGASSGGYLVAMLATVGEGAEEGGAAEPVRRPACVIAAYAPLDLTPLGLDGNAVGYTVSFMGHPPFYAQMGDYERRSFEADYIEASPLHHVSAQTSRMLLLHGDKDTLVPIDQSERFAAALRKAGGHVEFTPMPGVAHTLPPAYADKAADWLSRCMAEPAS